MNQKCENKKFQCDGQGMCFQHHNDCNPESNHVVFKGGEKVFDIYCKRMNSNCCCELKKCHNFQYCKRLMPEFLLNVNHQMCIYCAVIIGKLTFHNKIDSCPICYEKKELVQVSCDKHSFCLDCWEKHCEINKSFCPLCRESIWKWKKN